MKQRGTQELSLVSYLRLRRIVGILGVVLPIASPKGLSPTYRWHTASLFYKVNK